MSEPFLAEIRMVGFNFAPRGWAYCDGQILPINQNQALYSLLDTTYGGDGQTTFALPDLRGRIVFHVGNGMSLGQKAGEEIHSLTVQEMPAHNHTLLGSADRGDSFDPADNLLAESSVGDLQYASEAPNGDMSGAAIGNTGSGQAHYNLPPYLVVNFVIALQGIFPSPN
jgi:microcystin-dependent protein